MSELRRRNVLRMAALYVVAAWLVMQVADVLIGLLNLSAWIGPAVLILFSVGFPIALILSWFYELTPEGIALESDVKPGEPGRHARGRRLDIIVIALLCAAVLMFAYDKWSTVEHPVITEYRKLTESSVMLPPVTSILPLVHDQSRIYFTDFSDGDYAIRQVLRTGGAAVRFDVPGRGHEFMATPLDITPDGKSLLLSAHDEDVPVFGAESLWTAPIVGGSLRRIGEGRVAAYSSDGSKIAYVIGNERLFLANADMSEPKQIATLPGRAYVPSFSPDGSRISLTVFKGSLATNLWEVTVDGGEPKQILSDWPMDSLCCGSWTPDGKYFVFEARQSIRSQVWAIRDLEGAEPFQLTTGAIDYVRPTVSDDGLTIFASGWQLRGEVMEFDPVTRSYTTISGLEGMSVDQVDYSADERWITYIKYPEFTLWRKSVDADSALQLTFYPMVAAQPRWSPDGQSIAFTGWISGEPSRIYTVPVNGGELKMISNPESYSGSPTWSPDGERLMFSEGGSGRPKIVDLVTETAKELDGTDRFFAPSWSPDGRYVAGWSGGDLVLHDMEKGKSTTLADGKMYDQWYWSEDGQSLLAIDSMYLGSERSAYRISIDDGAIAKVRQIGREIGAFGSGGRWFGVNPDGKLMMLRNHSVHNIYALEWNPE